jgi:hypothetical protein
MGLDMYAWKTKDKEDEKVSELAYWRKHNRLHGWMGDLWEEKGYPNQHGDSYQFNCIPLELTKDDLLELRKAIKNRTMPDTQGFFFGHDSYDEGEYQKEVDKYDLKFVTNALRAIRQGYKVTYDSWW